MAEVSGVYDHPPEDVSMPVVCIGNSTINDAGTKTEDLIDYTAQIDVYADSLSYVKVKTIQELIRSTLHRQALSVDSGKIVTVFQEYADVISEPDGETRGIQRFAILYQYA